MGRAWQGSRVESAKRGAARGRRRASGSGDGEGQACIGREHVQRGNPIAKRGRDLAGWSDMIGGLRVDMCVSSVSVQVSESVRVCGVRASRGRPLLRGARGKINPSLTPLQPSHAVPCPPVRTAARVCAASLYSNDRLDRPVLTARRLRRRRRRRQPGG